MSESGIDWSDLLSSAGLSLRVAAGATVLAGLVAVPLAFALSRRPFRGRAIVEAVVALPLVLPPTVVGYLLVVGLGRRGVAGWTGVEWLFRERGAVVAAAVVALPLVYLPSRSAFAAVPADLVEAATVAGAGRGAMLWHVVLPAARRGVAAGLVLGFARALGEFGATLMVLGSRPGGRTLPVSIYLDTYSGDAGRAVVPCLVLAGLSLGAVLAYGRVGRGE